MNCRLRKQNGSIWHYLVHDNFLKFGLDKGTIIEGETVYSCDDPRADLDDLIFEKGDGGSSER